MTPEEVARPRAPARARRRDPERAAEKRRRGYAVKQGTHGVVLDCTRCGVTVETIDIGRADVAPLVAETFVCCLCMSEGVWGDGADSAPPPVAEAPTTALVVLQAPEPPPAEPKLDILALLGGPEGTPERPPVLLVPAPPLPEAAEHEHADADAGSHLDEEHSGSGAGGVDAWGSEPLW